MNLAQWRFPDFSSVLLLVPAVSVVLSIVTFRHRKSGRTAGLLFLLSLLTTFWTLSYILELSAVSQNAQYLANNLSYIPIVSVPVLLLIFIIEASGLVDILSPLKVTLLFVLPVVILILIWTSPYHHMFYSTIEFLPEPGRSVMTVGRGPFYWIFIAYAYVCLLFGTVISVRRALVSRGVYRWQAGLLAVGTLLPWAGSISDILMGTHGNVNFMQLSFVLSDIAFIVGIQKFKITEISPIARGTLVDRMEESMLVLNRSGRIVDANHAMETVLNRKRKDILGKDAKEVFAGWHKNFLNILDGYSRECHTSPPTAGRKPMHLKVTGVTLKSQRGTALGTLVMMINVTARVETEKQNEELRKKLHEQAIRDPLTGLYNRRFLEEISDQLFARINRKNGRIGFLFIDIDFFKPLNDKYGHPAGDAVLIALAGILSNQVRKSDIVSRYGGEEFLIVFPDAGLPEILDRAEAMRRSFESTPTLFDGQYINTTFSGGVSTYPKNGNGLEELIKAADQAMYKAKETGRNQIVVA